jgi:hypothetical protein
MLELVGHCNSDLSSAEGSPRQVLHIRARDLLVANLQTSGAAAIKACGEPSKPPHDGRIHQDADRQCVTEGSRFVPRDRLRKAAPITEYSL